MFVRDIWEGHLCLLGISGGGDRVRGSRESSRDVSISRFSRDTGGREREKMRGGKGGRE